MPKTENPNTYIGKPCKRGHSGERYFGGGACRQCNIDRMAKKNQKYKEAAEAKRKGKRPAVKKLDTMAAFLAGKL